jgi:hypothetical protein
MKPTFSETQYKEYKARHISGTVEKVKNTQFKEYIARQKVRPTLLDSRQSK